MAVIVGNPPVHIDGLDKRQMKLTTIHDPDVSTSLHRAVQEVAHYLVSHQEAQELGRPLRRNDPKKRRAIRVRALVLQRRKSIAPDRRVRNRRSVAFPLFNLS